MHRALGILRDLLIGAVVVIGLLSLMGYLQQRDRNAKAAIRTAELQKANQQFDRQQAAATVQNTANYMTYPVAQVNP